MIDQQFCPSRDQSRRPDPPYDRWLAPAKNVIAEFYRITGGYLLRFPGEVDFEIFPGTEPGAAPDTTIVRRIPAPQADVGHLDSLYHNAVLPILGNYRGGLFLHGSAVTINGAAVAFLGLSRSGKTTLAAAMAKRGHALLTEDVIELEVSSSGFQLQPKPTGLRLFSDSAAFLMGEDPVDERANIKRSVSPAAGFAVATAPAPLSSIYFLGQDRVAPLSIRHVGPSDALKEMLNHAFILDVEDKPRLKAHFGRMADLSEKIPCFALDYPRRYTELDAVLDAIVGVSLGRGKKS